ncbi:MAG: LysE family translocator [Mycobacterium sp.]|nr:LysE family translocator [Mycobacterium sp.]
MHSLHVVNWAAFLVVAALVSATPGANQLLGLRNAIRFGFAWAGVGIVARLAGLAVLIALVVFGLAEVFATSPVTLTVFKWIGVLYLLFIGVAAIRARPLPSEPADLETAARLRADRRRIALDEFVTATTNPKAVLLFAALFPQFVVTDTNSHVQMAALGVVYLVVEGVVGSIYAASGSVLRVRGPSSSTLRRFDIGAGCCFILLAVALAAESL